MVTQDIATNTKKDKQILMFVNIAHTLNFISKKIAGKILRQYKKTGHTFDPTSYMLDKRYINKLDLLSLKKSLRAFETIQDDARFGALCISFNFLTNSNLEFALREQKLLIAKGQSMKLGELLAEAGMTSKGQRHLVLIKQKANLKAFAKLSEVEGRGEKNFIINKKSMREIKGDNLIFFIQHDSLMAYLSKTASFDSATSLEELKQFIANQRIVHGVSNDEQLQHFLDSKKYSQGDYFKLAEGDAPIDGVDATKKIYFKEEYKVAGKVGIDGNIDYKERGHIPFVNKNDLLAEKIPAREGESGLDIFDKILPPEAPKEIFLKPGTGTKTSADGLKIYAGVYGYPKKTITDEILVNEIFVIDGDVDYNTGHINYNKSVKITGSIKNGFKVNAIDIVADEIDGGIIHAQGDVVIKKGIIDTKINAKGKITASYILRSNISCFGDIVVLKEIADSRILSDGQCRVKAGKVFASSITVKKGADIRNIGAEKAKRVTLTIGTSPNYDKKSKELDELIKEKQNELEQIIYEKNNLPNEIKKFKDAEAECSKLLGKYIKDKLILKKTDQGNPPKPVVKVKGTIVSGTMILGKHSKLIINKSQKRVKIIDTKISGNDTSKKDLWEMVISELKPLP